MIRVYGGISSPGNGAKPGGVALSPVPISVLLSAGVADGDFRLFSLLGESHPDCQLESMV